ncbi:MAG TPA: VOC family protein [Kofleriaceae bacterium]|nr:VOC family protein [Kofleriaceae bacterium]
MILAIDHLVVAARTLEEGAAWVEARLHVAPGGGGRHALMGTHNQVLSLGGGVYLEVIAVDPAAAPPGRARWLALDSPAMRERLAGGPALIHWMARTDDIAGAAAACPVDLGEVLAASRGDLRWRITVPRDGGLPVDGVFPSLIQWDGPAPSATLPDAGCRLEALEIAHPRAAWIADALRSMGMPRQAPLVAVDGAPGMVARVHTPGGACLVG